MDHPIDSYAAFWDCVAIAPDDKCWEWLGHTGKNRYPRAYLRKAFREELGITTGGAINAYRVAYRLHYGQLDPNLTIDHMCHNPSCCNPDHLRQCSLSENSKRHWFHVFANHPVTGESREERKRTVYKHGARNKAKRDEFISMKRSSNLSVCEIARMLGIPQSTADRWSKL